MIATEIYGVLLLMTCGLTVTCAFYAVHGNYRPLLNKLLVLIGCAVVVWSFGLALTAAARDPQMSGLGRRIAPLGWGMIAGVTMHFVLELTHNSLQKKYRNLILIYLPGVVTVFGNTVLPLFGRNPDVLIHTDSGWINMSELDAWDGFFYTYTLVFILIATILLLRWGRQAASLNVRKQARIIGYSFIAGAVLGTAADVLPAYLQVPFPQTSAIYMSGLILAVCYCVSRYHFLQPETASRDELILSKAARTHVYRYLGLGVLACGLLLLFVQDRIVPSDALPLDLIVRLLLAAAAFLMLVDRLRLEDKAKEMLVSISFSFLVPLISLWFADAGVYVTWAFIFPLFILCLLFNRQIILAALIATSFLTQLFQWAHLPTANMTITALDYLFRLGIIGFSALFALYVNKIYTTRLRENISHTAMQTIAAEISQDFVSAGEETINEKLYAALERCGEFIRCDRAQLVLLDEKTREVRYGVEWPGKSAVPPGGLAEADGQDTHLDLFQFFRASDVLVLKDIRLLPPLAAKIKKRLLAQGIRALADVAIKNTQGEIIGFLGFNADRPMREWNLDSTGFIEITAGIIADALARLDSERGLSRMAYHDQLTGLPNRILLRDKLAQAVAAAQNTGKMVGVAFLDLDLFKAVNDTLGHDQGDRLLTEIARALSAIIREGDTVARFGGDEFIVLLDRLSSQSELLRIMDRLMERVQKPVMLAGQEFFVSVSAGVAIYPQDGQDPDTLLKNADTAMYAAKSSGKSRYVLCSQSMKNEIRDRVELTHLLYRALEKKQLVLHYQPQIDVGTHAIVGLEALARWNLPERGEIGPTTFIPLAEQTGLIHAIGDWVLREACTRGRRFLDLGCSGLRMAVNISVHQLKNPGFVQQVEAVLKSTGLPPANLELEITESVANDNADNLVSLLHRLKALGVLISIDDFGTKYSSLSRLKMLPIDRIKMDMQFIHGIEKNGKDKAISKVIINLAKSLQLKVIAEGVETAPQLDFLRQRMCDEVQGYFYYKPLPGDEIEVILKQQLSEEQKQMCALVQAVNERF